MGTKYLRPPKLMRNLIKDIVGKYTLYIHMVLNSSFSRIVLELRVNFKPEFSDD